MADLTAHWRILFENKYMGSWNLWLPARNSYGTVTVIIESAALETVTMDKGRKSRAMILRFKGKRTPLILTKKMGKSIERMYGVVPQGWIGKEITLYVERGFKTSDGPADVLRIKNTRAGDSLKSHLRGEDPATPDVSEEPEMFADDGSDDPDKGP